MFNIFDYTNCSVADISLTNNKIVFFYTLQQSLQYNRWDIVRHIMPSFAKEWLGCEELVEVLCTSALRGKSIKVLFNYLHSQQFSLDDNPYIINYFRYYDNFSALLPFFETPSSLFWRALGDCSNQDQGGRVLSLFLPRATVADLVKVMSGLTPIWGMAKAKLMFNYDQHKTSAAFLLLRLDCTVEEWHKWLQVQINQLNLAVQVAMCGQKCHGPHYTVQKFLGLW